MIPSTRPVVGRDLDDLRQSLGMSTADACNLFGISIVKWGDLTKKKAEETVKDPTLALLVRIIDHDPSIIERPAYPNVEEMFAELNSVREVDQRKMSLLLGNEASAAYRWRSRNTRQSPVSQRLMLYIKKSMEKGEPERFLDHWRQTVLNEGYVRTKEDVFKTGRWTVAGAPRSEG